MRLYRTVIPLKYADRKANSADQDQTAPCLHTKIRLLLGLHRLPRPACPNIKAHYVIIPAEI